MLEFVEYLGSWEFIKCLFVLFNIFCGILVYYKSKQAAVINKIIEKQEQNINKNRVCLAIAHPDDEAMFFSPLLTQLQEDKKEVSVICLSSGNFEGKGEIRKTELKNSCKLFNISNVEIIDHPDLQDGPKNKWKSELIANFISEFMKKNKCGVLITFDQHGVSSHPNHIDVHHGAKILYQTSQVKWSSKEKLEDDLDEFQLYYLDTTNIFRKYIGFFDIFFSLWSPGVYVSYLPTKSFEAMKAHQSQFIWFRKLFVIFSRYGYLNTLTPHL